MVSHPIERSSEKSLCTNKPAKRSHLSPKSTSPHKDSRFYFDKARKMILSLEKRFTIKKVKTIKSPLKPFTSSLNYKPKRFQPRLHPILEEEMV